MDFVDSLMNDSNHTNRKRPRDEPVVNTTPIDVENGFDKLKDLPYEYYDEDTWRSMDRATAERHQKKQQYIRDAENVLISLQGKVGYPIKYNKKGEEIILKDYEKIKFLHRTINQLMPGTVPESHLGGLKKRRNRRSKKNKRKSKRKSLRKRR